MEQIPVTPGQFYDFIVGPNFNSKAYKWLDVRYDTASMTIIASHSTGRIVATSSFDGSTSKIVNVFVAYNNGGWKNIGVADFMERFNCGKVLWF